MSVRSIVFFYSNMKQFLLLIFTLLIFPNAGLWADQSSSPGFYSTREVTLLESPFQRAQQRNYQTLMAYDVDRLLTPYLRQSGLSSTKDTSSPYFEWEYRHPASQSFAWYPVLAMDGHFLGHYLSALCHAYVSCRDAEQCAAFKARIDHIVQVLCDCQAVFDKDKTGMKGFIGGLPDNRIWTALLTANYNAYNERGNWSPYAVEQKIMAGLRDAYLLAGNQSAKEAFRLMCDWVIQTVALFNEDLMELQILRWETGGMNEVLADAYEMFGESRYLKAAHKFTQQLVVENMNSDPGQTFLNKRGTNEISSIFAGCYRIHERKKEPRYINGALNFWRDAVGRRITAIGGVGIGGNFVSKSKAATVITDADGPDLCTTSQLIRISSFLFEHRPNPQYADYMETALLNHVLASQDPVTGGHTYFTSLRPESYKIYSKVDEAMWCCAGTGLEYQSRYGEYIYSMVEDTLYINLFIPSELRSGKVALRQESSFPYGEQSRITIQKSGYYQLAVRHPSWATGGYQVKVNGKPVQSKVQVELGVSSYVYCGRVWHEGDVVEIEYPMTLTFVTCPNYDSYIALRYGPSVLAVQTSSTERGTIQYDPLSHEYGGNGLNDFSPKSREQFPNVAFAPMLICERNRVPERIRMVNREQLEFEVDASAPGSDWKILKMKPFFDLHHSRYSIYWNQQTQEEWQQNPMYKDYASRIEVELATFDLVLAGESSSETSHSLNRSEGDGARGVLNGRTFREAPRGEWFEYTLNLSKAQPEIAQGKDLRLLCLLDDSDMNRSCDILIDGEKIDHLQEPEIEAGKGKNRLFERTSIIPARLLSGKEQVVVRMTSVDESLVPRFLQIRLLK